MRLSSRVHLTMAAFTGSPPPRRKNRPPSRQAAPSPPPRRVGRFASSKPASRLPTPARSAEQSSFVREDDTIASMNIDEDTLQPTERGLIQDTVFAKSEEMLVTFHGHLPTEVKHVLRNAGERARVTPPAGRNFLHCSAIDFFRDAYVGDVDAQTGFALVATPQACFVWQHTQELAGIPTCYIFPCPVDPSQAAPLYAFVPYGGSREPGLILTSQSGEMWFWNNIGVGLAGGEQYSKILLELESNENINSLMRLDVRSFCAIFMFAQVPSASNLCSVNLFGALVPANADYLWWKTSPYFSPFLPPTIFVITVSLLAFSVVFTHFPSRSWEHRGYCSRCKNKSRNGNLGTCRVPCPEVECYCGRLGRVRFTGRHRCYSSAHDSKHAAHAVRLSGSRIT